MAFKVNMFYTQESELTAGWTMTFWNDAADFATVIPRTQNLAAKLNTMASIQAKLTRARIAEIGNFRRVKLLPFTFPQKIGNIGSAYDGDSVTASLLLEYRKEDTTRVYIVRQWLRGIPDPQIQDGGKMILGGAFQTALNAFKTYMVSGGDGWSLWVQDKAIAEKVISGATSAGIITALAHGYAATQPPTRVRIKNASKFRYLNRIWKINAVTTDTFQVSFYDPTKIPPADLGNPVAILQTKVLKGIGEVNVIRATKHNTGRPSRVYSGRRKKPLPV